MVLNVSKSVMDGLQELAKYRGVPIDIMSEQILNSALVFFLQGVDAGMDRSLKILKEGKKS